MKLFELAEKIGAVLEGCGDAEITRLAALDNADTSAISFLSNDRYAAQVATTKAAAVIVSKSWSGESSAALLRAENPDKAFSRAGALLAPPPPPRTPGIHPTAIIAPSAKIGEGTYIGPYCVIEDNAEVGAQSVIEAFCFIGVETRIGECAHLYPRVTIRERVTVGDRVIMHPGVVIGADGFGFIIERPTPERPWPNVEKIPQIGTVVIGNDVEIGANTTIDRARFGQTRIGNCVKIDNLVQIGHNVRVDDFSGLIAQSGVAGSTHISSGVMVWAQAGLSGHLHIGLGAQIGPQAGVTRDVAPGEYVIGSPAVPKREFVAQMAAPRTIERLKKRIEKIEIEADK